MTMLEAAAAGPTSGLGWSVRAALISPAPAETRLIERSGETVRIRG